MTKSSEFFSSSKEAVDVGGAVVEESTPCGETGKLDDFERQTEGR